MNIRFIACLLLPILLLAMSCTGHTSDAEPPSQAYSAAEEPLNLKVGYISNCYYYESLLSVQGDSIFFYDIHNGRDTMLLKSSRLHDWQIKNLRQLASCVRPDTICYNDFPITVITDLSGRSLRKNDTTIMVSIDPCPNIEPSVLTLYKYMFMISPYNYEENEWLKDLPHYEKRF